MDTNLPTELYWMTLSVAMTAIFFVPYVVYKILETGLWNTLKTPDPVDRPKAEWPSRARRAHDNAVENLVIFCPLVIAVVFLGKQNEITAMASMIFFYARLTHNVVYIADLPAIRTLAFFAGFLVQLTLAYQILFA
jgi:uncharacterized MAPEG superfamily protein